MSINPDLLSIIQQAMNRGQMPQQPLDPMGGAQAGIDPRIAAIMGQTAPQAPQRGEEQPHPIQDLLAGIIDAFGRKNATLAGITPPPSALEGLRSRRSQKTERDYEKAFTDYQVKREEFLRDQALATEGVKSTIEGEQRGKERKEDQARHEKDQQAIMERLAFEQQQINERNERDNKIQENYHKQQLAIAKMRTDVDEVQARSVEKEQREGVSKAKAAVAALASDIPKDKSPAQIRQEFDDMVEFLRLTGPWKDEVTEFFERRLNSTLKTLEGGKKLASDYMRSRKGPKPERTYETSSAD